MITETRKICLSDMKTNILITTIKCNLKKKREQQMESKCQNTIYSKKKLGEGRGRLADIFNFCLLWKKMLQNFPFKQNKSISLDCNNTISKITKIFGLCFKPYFIVKGEEKLFFLHEERCYIHIKIISLNFLKYNLKRIWKKVNKQKCQNTKIHDIFKQKLGAGREG